MAYELRPTLSALLTRVTGDMRSRLGGFPLLRRSVERVIGFAVAGVAHGVHGHLEWVRRQLTPVRADLEVLREWGEWLPLAQKPGTRATGTVRFEADMGVEVDAGALLTAGGVPLRVTVGGSGAGGHLDVTVEALEAGAAGNLSEGTDARLVSPVAGVTSPGVLTADMSGGADEEEVEAYRARVLDELRHRTTGGGEGDYRRWALEVEGVTRAWERPRRMGAGTVSVAFVMDGRDNRIPLSPDVAAVQAHLDARRPLDMRAVYVAAPVPKPVAMTIGLTPNTAEVRAAVSDELAALFLEADFEAPLSRSQVDEAISRAAGETSHTITVIGTLTPGTWGILTLGTVTYANEAPP